MLNFFRNEPSSREVEYWDDDCDSEFDPTEHGNYVDYLLKTN